MKARKLIPMVDYVEMLDTVSSKDFLKGDSILTIWAKKFVLANEYAKFLKTELNVSMFVPAIFEDGQWVILEKPKVESNKCNVDGWNFDIDVKEVEQYQAALDNVIFEAFKLIEISHGLRIIKNKELDCKVYSNRFQNHYYKCNEFDTIEDLTEYSPILTKKAYEKYFKS